MGLAGGLTHAMLSSASRLAPAITERGHLAAGSQLSTVTRGRLLLCETRGGRADHGGGECSSEQKPFHATPPRINPIETAQPCGQFMRTGSRPSQLSAA